MEIRADNATFEANKLNMSILAKEQIGESKTGRIIDISPSGILVKTDDQLVGKVSLNDVLYGKYKYYKETNSIEDKVKEQAYHLADRVEVLVKDGNKEKRTVDFSLVDKAEEKCLTLKRNAR
jgi:exoribonuclease R